MLPMIWYFLCDNKMSFLDLATSMPKKYFKGSRFLVWKYFCKYFRLSIPFVSYLAIIISSTYTTNMILFSWCIRQNLEWSFSAESLMQSAPNQALRDCFKSLSDIFNLQTFTHSPWATKPDVAPYTPLHQEYQWESHSWCPTDEVTSGMSLLMTQGSAYMSSSWPGRRYLHNAVHTHVSIYWQPISPLSESETHLDLTWTV